MRDTIVGHPQVQESRAHRPREVPDAERRCGPHVDPQRLEPWEIARDGEEVGVLRVEVTGRHPEVQRRQVWQHLPQRREARLADLGVARQAQHVDVGVSRLLELLEERLHRDARAVPQLRVRRRRERALPEPRRRVQRPERRLVRREQVRVVPARRHELDDVLEADLGHGHAAEDERRARPGALGRAAPLGRARAELALHQAERGLERLGLLRRLVAALERPQNLLRHVRRRLREVQRAAAAVVVAVVGALLARALPLAGWRRGDGPEVHCNGSVVHCKSARARSSWVARAAAGSLGCGGPGDHSDGLALARAGRQSTKASSED